MLKKLTEIKIISCCVVIFLTVAPKIGLAKAVGVDPFACGLWKKEIATDNVSLTCSVTFASPSRAITAAHCFDFMDRGAPTHFSNRYYITCPGKDEAINVQAVAIHPGFIEREKMKDPGISLDRIFDAHFDHNDVAVLLTDEAHLTAFAKLPFLNYEAYIDGSCHSYGFSKGVCQSETGCLRQDFSLQAASTPMLPMFVGEDCNIFTGQFCYGLDLLNGAPSAVPLLYRSTTTSIASFNVGDSGAGIFCDTNSNENLLAGIVLGTGFSFVNNVASHSAFLNHFLTIPRADFIVQTKPVLPKDLKHLLQSLIQVEIQLGHLKYKPSGRRILLGSISRANLQVLKEMETWLESEDRATEFSNLLRKNTITEIYFPNVSQSGRHNIDTNKGLINIHMERIDSGAENMLFFSSEVHFLDILAFLRASTN